jgi:outer membrane protein assembly factor BamA
VILRALPALALCSLLVASTLCWARRARADVPAALAGRRIVEIEVEGGGGAGDLEDVGIVPGVVLERSTIREAIVGLLATGTWADVQIDAVPREGGVVLQVQLTPRILVTRIELHGNAAIGDDELLQTLRIREGGELEAGELPSMVDEVRELYSGRG